MKHPIIEDLLWRHATKKFDPTRRVSPEDLGVVLEAIRLSPSSINAQPWRFVVVESPEAKARLDRTFVRMHHYNRPHVFDSTAVILFAYNPRYTREDYDRVLDQHVADGRIRPDERDSAFASFSFAEANTDADGYTGTWTRAQTYLALGNALHALARLRVDATPLEGVDVERVNEAFESELGGYRCEVALAVGYHDPGGDYNARLPKSRLPPDRVFVRV